MKTKTILKLIPITAVLGLWSAQAETPEGACSPIIGFNKVKILGNSDTHISIPFHQAPYFTGVLDSAPTTTSIDLGEGPEDAAVVTLSNADFTGQTLAGTHYLRFTSGTKNGFWYNIHASTADSVTLILNGDVLTGVTTGDSAVIIPHWTFATLFSVGEGALTASTSQLAFINRGSELLFPEHELVDINKSAAVYFFYKPAGDPDGHWERDGVPNVSEDDTVIPPNSYVIVRHRGDDFDFCADGRVPIARHAVQIDVGIRPNDNYFSVDRPVDTSLDESGLVNLDNDGNVIPGPFTVSTSTLAFINRGDEVLLIDNTTRQFNKSASVYYFLDDATHTEWRQDGGSENVGAMPLFKAGQTVIVRKRAGVGDATTFLTNTAPYSQP